MIRVLIRKKKKKDKMAVSKRVRLTHRDHRVGRHRTCGARGCLGWRGSEVTPPSIFTSCVKTVGSRQQELENL